MRYRKLVAAFDEHIKNLTNGELDYARELFSRVSEIIDARKKGERTGQGASAMLSLIITSSLNPTLARH